MKKNLNRLKKIDFDRLFLKLLILSGIIAGIVAITFFISWFFDINIQSLELWAGTLIAILIIIPIFIAPFYWKIAFVLMSFFVIPYYLSNVLGLSLFVGLFFGLTIIILILSIYLSI